MVNKALALFQARQDFESASVLCEEALQLDPTCDVAVATLAQLLLQQNKVEEAVTMFARSAELARTEPELVNALTYEHVRSFLSLSSSSLLVADINFVCVQATRAQIAFTRNYPSVNH
jgi:tetratricopeptide (TPR) repeat protein